MKGRPWQPAIWPALVLTTACGAPSSTPPAGPSTVTTGVTASPRPSTSLTPPPAPAPPRPSSAQEAPVTRTDVDRWLSFRDLSQTQIMTRIGADARHVRRGVKYQRLTNLIEVRNEKADPAFFHFRDDKLVLLYVSGKEALGALRAPALYAQLGGRGVELASRSCHSCVLHVYPQKGVAFSSEGDDLNFVEVFPPTTIEAYQAEVYIEPTPWLR
ncbi:MAG: hypothetical protein QM820_48560 [Minicystis sp.]